MEGNMPAIVSDEKGKVLDETLLPTLLSLLSTKKMKSIESDFQSVSPAPELNNLFSPLPIRARSELGGSSSTLNPLATSFAANLQKSHRGTGPQELLGLHRRLTRTASDPIKLREGMKSWKSGETTPDLTNSKDITASSRYKTELCRQFEESGLCKYADKCQFAHGKRELRQMTRHPKYKTDLCRTYHTTGYCPYGIRCHFVHDDDETTEYTSNNRQQLLLEKDVLDEQLQTALLEQQLEQVIEEQKQQQRKQELLVAALTQARRSSSLFSPLDRSHSLHSPNIFSSSTKISSPRTRPSVYDSLGSLPRSCSPSSVSESPLSSPSLSMFEGLRVNTDDVTMLSGFESSFLSVPESAPANLAPGYGRSTSVFHGHDTASSNDFMTSSVKNNSDICSAFAVGPQISSNFKSELDIESPIANLDDAMLDDVISVLQDLVCKRVRQLKHGSVSSGDVGYGENSFFSQFSTQPSLTTTGVM